ncbi:hypothetical protein CH302_22775 [Rhodococcus sp. 15-2388-1-1a]|uniref:hypothetical protein n=1 Tax=Nocardiaceae TaxID=85025 RepID=UPI00068D47ED|nr:MULTISPECIES: hypothetical protein [Rhodococcus]OZE93275.1 hypothetical protein CH302_22775 [Rhodococcus sp. 15-2388-1-1a]
MAGSRALATAFAALTIASIVLLIYVGNWALVGLVLAMLVAGCLTFWSVKVSDAGIEARATYGWPRVQISADEIDSASVTDVHPMRDWAGWGLRFNTKGDTGIVLRSGTAVSIEKKDGSRTVITARDSEQAVAALNRVLDRR